MKVKKAVGVVCPECEAFIRKVDMPGEVTWFQCGECEEIYEDRDEAKECCKS